MAAGLLFVRRKSVRVFVLILMGMLVLVGCQSNQNTIQGGAATAVPTVEPTTTPGRSGLQPVPAVINTPKPTLAPVKFTLKGDGTAVATVNGSPITLQEFSKEATKARQSFADQGVDVESAEGKQQLNQVYNQILETMIAQELVRQAAKTMGITVADTDVKAEMDRILAQVGGEDGLTKALAAQGLTREDLNTLIRDRVTINKLASQITKDLPTTSEQVHARHILVASEAEAKKVVDRLKAGEDFAVIAKEVSTDPSGKTNGGDLGWFGRGMMVPTFEEAAFALPLKKISDPVQSQFGYHIIEVLEKEVAHPIPPDQLDQQREDKLVDWLEQQHKAAKIEQLLTLE